MINFAQLGIMLSGGLVTARGIADVFQARVLADRGVYEADICLVDRITTLRTLGFYDSASLILTPNGYKESKLYSLVPSDGTGDFVPVRASTKIRKGVTNNEVVPTNLASQTETLSSGTWSKLRCNVTEDATIDPNGNNTADRLFITDNTGVVRLSGALATPGSNQFQYTFVIYAKQDNHTGSIEICASMGAGSFETPFTITAGVFAALGGGNFGGVTLNSTTSTSVGNGWYKLKVVATTTTAGSFSPYIDMVGGQNNEGIYLWGANIAAGSVEPSYFKTTTRFNVPSIDYTFGSCPSICLEAQRTNLLLRSEEIDNVFWTKTNSSATANAAVAPDNLTTADKLIEDTATSTHYLEVINISGLAAPNTYTFSIHLKAAERTWCSVEFLQAGSPLIGVFVNLASGVFGSNYATGTPVNKSIVSLGNGWYRVDLQVVKNNTAANLEMRVCLATANGTARQSYLGTSSGIYVFGAQLELGLHLTSYIPTTVATVTRVTDSFTPLTGISSLIGQTEGTLFFEGSSFTDAVNKDFSISDGTANNIIILRFSTANVISTVVITGGTTFVSLNSAVFTSNTVYKIAVTYITNKVALFVNGVKIAEDLSVTIPACSRIGFDGGTGGTNNMRANVKAVVIYKTAMSDSEAISLTT